MDPIIAGVLFDLMGHLTTLEKPIVLGTGVECAPQLIEELRAWAKERGLNIDNPDLNWEKRDRQPMSTSYLMAELGRRFDAMHDSIKMLPGAGR